MQHLDIRFPLAGLICLFCSVLSGQSGTFQKIYGADDYATVFDMVETADGYLVAGAVQNQATGYTDALAIKMDKAGAVIWKKTYGQFANDAFYKLAHANDGGFIAWGVVQNLNLNRYDAWLAKLDDNGNLDWQKSIGEPGFNESPNGKIIPMPDGYILSGSQHNPGYFQSFVLRVNNTGDTMWSRFTPASDYNNMNASYVVDSLLYLTGTINNFGAWRTMNTATGAIVQSRHFLVDSTNWMFDMHRTPDGGHFMTGELFKDIPGLIRYYGWVQKADPQGTMLWSKIYRMGEVCNITSSTMLADGSAILALHTRPDFQLNDLRSALVKIDPDGAVVWTRVFSGEQGLYLTGIDETADGGFFVTGYTQVVTGPTVHQNAFWAKTDSLGRVGDCCMASPGVVVEDVAITEHQASFTETAFENTIPYQFGFADTAPLEVLDHCNSAHPLVNRTVQFCPGESVTLGDSTYSQPTTVIVNIPSVTFDCDTIVTYTLEYKTTNACIDSACAKSFIKRFSVPGKSTLGYKIVPAPNETFFVAASADDKMVIAHTDKNMEVIWARTMDMVAGTEVITDVRLDAEGQIIGVGNGFFSPIQCFAFKMNPATGQILWLSQLNSPINSFFTKILEKNKDGSENYFLVGQTDAASGGSGCDALLIEIDRNTGELIWDKHYNLGSCEIFNDVYIENNLIYACGRYNLDNSGQAGFRPALTLLDIDGNVQWSRHYLRSGGVNARLYASSMVPDNGGIILFGYGAGSGTNLLTTTLQLMKTSMTGELLWVKEYNITGGTEQLAFDLVNFPDGYLLSGTFVRAGAAGREMFLIKTDKNGNILWQKSYGRNGEDRFRDVIRVADKLFLVGSTQNGQIFDMLIGKLNLDGTVDSDGACNYVKPVAIEEKDFDTLYSSAHTLSQIPVFHNYATTAAPAVTTDSLLVEAICLKICADTCFGKADASVFVDTIYCNAGRTDARIRVCNTGSVALPANTPVSLYDGNPADATVNLLLTVLSNAVIDTGACLTMVIPDIASFFPNGDQITLAAVANDDGSHPTPFPLDSLHHSAIEECDYSNNLGIGVLVKPVSPLLELGPDRSVCGAGKLVLNVGPGFYQYTWQDGSADAAFTVQTTGVYRIEVSDVCGFAQTDSVLVTVLPLVQRTELLEFCPGESVSIGGINYTQPGTVVDTIPALGGGCDTIVTYTLQYQNTNQQSALQLVCPKDTVVIAPAGVTAVAVAYNLPNAASDCVCPGVEVHLNAGGASGSLFPLGASTVCYRAEDACGSKKTCCFTVRVDRESVCDTKINGCLKFELVSVNRDAGQNWVYRIRITNNCSAELTYAYIQAPDGVQAMAPANNSLYTAPGGLTYLVRNPNFSPFYSLRFKPETAGLVNGQSDIFRYVLPAQTSPDYIHVAARLLSGAYVETHLNTFYCPVGTETANKHAAGERGAAGIAPALQVFPNPVTEGATLTIAGGDFPAGVFVLQDLTGKIVLERRIADNQVLLAPSGLSTGIYYFKIMENGRFAGSGKLVVQD